MVLGRAGCGVKVVYARRRTEAGSSSQTSEAVAVGERCERKVGVGLSVDRDAEGWEESGGVARASYVAEFCIASASSFSTSTACCLLLPRFLIRKESGNAAAREDEPSVMGESSSVGGGGLSSTLMLDR